MDELVCFAVRFAREHIHQQLRRQVHSAYRGGIWQEVRTDEPYVHKVILAVEVIKAEVYIIKLEPAIVRRLVHRARCLRREVHELFFSH